MQTKLENIGALFAVLACFSVAALGTAATSISVVLAILFWFISLKCSNYVDVIKSHSFALVAALLFIYMAVTLLWSDDISSGLDRWTKYLKFIFLPVFLSYFAEDKWRHYGRIALYSGMGVALTMSYLIFYDLIPFHPRQHSVGNHIFNGILMAYFSYWSLTLALNNKKYRLIFIVIFLLATVNVFVIRDGRTGYILYLALMTLLLFQNWKWKSSLAIIMLTLTAVLIWKQVELAEILQKKDYFSATHLAQLDIRLEFYINTIRMIIDNFLLGVGIGDYPSAYLEIAKAHEHFWPPTVNAHNQFLMIAAETGIIGIVLFIFFFIYLFKAALKFELDQSKFAIATIVTIIISCLFNSSFFDHNDGILLMLLIALFFSQPNATNAKD